MKTVKTKKGLVIGMMLLSLFGIIARVTAHVKESNPVIDITKKPTGSGTRPRSIDDVQLFAVVCDTYVQVYSDSNIGEVDVLLVSTAGDYYSTVFDTQDGSIILPISGDAGTYTINVTTPDGQEYEGEFEI